MTDYAELEKRLSLTKKQLNAELDRLRDPSWAVSARAAMVLATYFASLEQRIAAVELCLSRAPAEQDQGQGEK